MSNQVQLTQTVDQREVVNALQQQAVLIDKATQRLDQMGKKGEQAGKQGSNAFRGMAKDLASAGQEAFGIGNALDAVRNTLDMIKAEYEQIQAGLGRASQTQTTVAQKQRAAALNFGVADAGQMMQWTKEIVDKTGADTGAVLDAFSAGMSFKGNLDSSKVFESVMAAAELDPNDAAGLVTSTKGFLTQMKSGGGTAEEIAGFQLRVKQTSPVIANQDFANNVAPGIGSLMNMGVSDQEAGALMALLGHGLGDPNGAQTKTSAIQLVGQLKKFVPQANTVEEAAALVQANPKLRAELLGALDPAFSQGISAEDKKKILSGDLSGVPKMNLTGEAAALPTFVKLLSDPAELKKLQQFKQDVGVTAGSDAQFQQTIAQLNNIEQQQAQNQRNQMAAAVQQAQLANPGALAADVQKQFDEALTQYGYGNASRFYQFGEIPGLAQAAYAVSDIGLSPTQVDDVRYREQQTRQIAQNERDAGRIVQADALQALADKFAKTAEVIAEAEAKREQQNAQLVQALQQNTDATKNNTRNTDQTNPVNGQQRGE